MNDYLALALGVVFAGIGGELFVRGAVGLAWWARISPAIVGATVAAFATSSPELVVGISSAIAGVPEISFGDALGSNVVNVGLVLGLTLILGGIRSSRAKLKRDFPVALLVSVIIAVLGYDGALSRMDGVILLAIFFGWLGVVTLEVRRQRSVAEEVAGEGRRWLTISSTAVGLVFLMAAGRLIVASAKGIALRWGMGAFVVGEVIVAIGTSAPELATAIIAKIRGHDEIGLGTILGSNIFNCLWIVGVVSVIHPIVVPFRQVALALLFGIVTVALTYPTRSGLIERRRGFLLLALYVVYVVTAL
jgi:cation:H+ antiporter